ncbi:MAG: TRAM domain-containing protein, partial [Lachnospiraceae bacterium]|nr:TRAM domain-containing protein [Lachnospiraceae bacterium]
KQRQKKLMEIQREISIKRNKSFVSKKFTAIIDGYNSEDGFYIARLYSDAPDIDGNVFIESDEEYLSGTFVKVKITDCSEYDLIGEIIK